MTIKEIILLVLGGVLANNYVFEKYLGVCPILGGKKCSCKALETGLAVAVVMILSQAIIWPLTNLITGLGFGFINEVVSIAIVLALVYIIRAIIKKPLGGYFPLIALNSAVLGLCVNNVESASYLIALLTALGVGLGFLFAMLIFAGIKSKIDEKAVPEAFKGLPIYLVAAFIISMVLVAFK